MNPFLTCSSPPQPLHRSPIHSPHSLTPCTVPPAAHIGNLCDPETLAHSSGEVGEQGGACRGGADGAKGRDRGEGGTAKHGPDPEPGSRVPGAGPPTAGSGEEQEGEAHGAAAPCQPRHSALGLLRAEEGRSAGD